MLGRRLPSVETCTNAIRSVRSVARIAVVFLAISSAGACAHVKVHPLYRDHPVTDADPEDVLTRTQIESPGLRKGMFLINWVPDLVSNYVVSLKPGNLWPIQYLLWPFSGAYWGTRDAWHGYPFWEPSATWD